MSYSGSSSYRSGKYYTALTKVSLTGNQRTDIVNIAKSQVGYQEGSSSSQLAGTTYGGGNYTEYGRWYGMQDMWCAMFVSWCAHVAGVSSSVVPYHSYTPTGLNWFINKGRAYSRSTVASGGYTPQKGDIIYFKSARNSNITNHVGIVTDYKGRYIWKRGNTYTSRNISGVTIQPDEENTLAACLDAVLKKLGIVTVSKNLLDAGKSVEDIFKSQAGYDCLYLNGVPLEQVLYCVNEGRSVIGKIGENEYVVIIGYDSNNVTLLSAIKGNSYKMKIETASEQFKDNGNIFISYLEQ